jgi:hypothetical protein
MGNTNSNDVISSSIAKAATAPFEAEAEADVVKSTRSWKISSGLSNRTEMNAMVELSYYSD